MRLKSYDAVTIEMPRLRVTDDEVERRLANIVAQIPTYNDGEGREVVEAHDRIRARVTMEEEGMAMKGFDDAALTITVGDGFLPQAFSDNLLGMRQGERKDFSFALAALGSEDESDVSSQVNAHVEVLSLDKRIQPELSDEWVSAHISRFGTVEGLRADVVEELMRDRRSRYDVEKRKRCGLALATRVEGAPSADEIARAVSGVEANFERTLVQERKTKAEKLEELGWDDDRLDRYFQQEATMIVVQGMAVQAMADHLEMEVSQDDVDRVLHRNFASEEEAGKQMAAPGGKRRITEMARFEKTLDYVVDNARVVETDEQEAVRRSPRDAPNPFM